MTTSLSLDTVAFTAGDIPETPPLGCAQRLAGPKRLDRLQPVKRTDTFADARDAGHDGLGPKAADGDVVDQAQTKRADGLVGQGNLLSRMRWVRRSLSGREGGRRHGNATGRAFLFFGAALGSLLLQGCDAKSPKGGIVAERCDKSDRSATPSRAEQRLERPIEGDWPYLWIDATYVKSREDHRIRSIAVIIAVGVAADGHREVLGMATGPSEAEPFWTDFLRRLTRRGLRGTKLVISDAHERLKKAAAKVLACTWQRCRVHFMRNALAHVGPSQRPMVIALLKTIFAEESLEAAKARWREVADRLRKKFSRLAAMLDEAEDDVLAYMAFPKAHWSKIHSTNPIERLNAEVKRRSDVVGIFPNDAALVRLVGAILMEQSDEWLIQRRYMPLESLAAISDDPNRLLPVGAV